MKIPTEILNKIIDAFGIKNITIAALGGLSSGSIVFLILLALLDADGGQHE